MPCDNTRLVCPQKSRKPPRHWDSCRPLFQDTLSRREKTPWMATKCFDTRTLNVKKDPEHKKKSCLEKCYETRQNSIRNPTLNPSGIRIRISHLLRTPDSKSVKSRNHQQGDWANYRRTAMEGSHMTIMGVSHICRSAREPPLGTKRFNQCFGIGSHIYCLGTKKLSNSRSLTFLALHNTFALFYFGGPASPSDVCRSKLEGAWIMALASAPSPPTSTSNHPPMPYWPSLVQTSPSRGKHWRKKTDQEWKKWQYFLIY